MKRLKFLLVFAFLSVGTLTVMSFTNKKYHKSALIWGCLQYNGPQPMSTPLSILYSSNWSNMLVPPFPYCSGGYDLCAICFDNLTTTPNEAMQILYDYYVTNESFPPNGGAIYGFDGKMVVVYKKMARN